MANASASQGSHEAADLLVAPLLAESFSDNVNHAKEALRPLPGGTASMVATVLGLLGVLTLGNRIMTQFQTHRTAMNAKDFGDLPLAHAYSPISVNLVSLGLCQLLVSHALLHSWSVKQGMYRRWPSCL